MLTRCVDTQSDLRHCGACSEGRMNYACKRGELCKEGRCVLDCQEGFSACGEYCVDTMNNSEHCGGCADAGGEQCKLRSDRCIAGRCSCGSQQGLCAIHEQCANGKCISIECAKDDDCEAKFCDSALGYKCSMRCASDLDCENNAAIDGKFCRSDGRCASKIFETVWDISTKGRRIILPHNGRGNCDFWILWGDEEKDPSGNDDWTKATHIQDCTDQEARTHRYTNNALSMVNVKIRGTYNGYAWPIDIEGNCIAPKDAGELIAILSFGPVGIGSCAFHKSRLLFLTEEIPDSQKLVDMNLMFESALFNQSLANWDVSNVRHMTGTFQNATLFNLPLNMWNTSNVIAMNRMFQNAKAFNQDISRWDISNVFQLNRMFLGASSFNQDIGNWNTSNVTHMAGLFKEATRFNQNIGNWDTSKVTRMEEMFFGI
jgi:surface protein